MYFKLTGYVIKDKSTINYILRSFEFQIHNNKKLTQAMSD